LVKINVHSPFFLDKRTGASIIHQSEFLSDLDFADQGFYQEAAMNVLELCDREIAAPRLVNYRERTMNDHAVAIVNGILIFTIVFQLILVKIWVS